MKDLEFKKLIKELKYDIGLNLNEFYHPDGVLIYNNFHFIFEHTSTGDRKVHIGELLQAFEYAISNNCNVKLIMILDNSSNTPPKKNKEMRRLSYYLNFLKNLKLSTHYNFEIIIKHITEVDDIDKLRRFVLES